MSKVPSTTRQRELCKVDGLDAVPVASVAKLGKTRRGLLMFVYSNADTVGWGVNLLTTGLVTVKRSRQSFAKAAFVEEAPKNIDATCKRPRSIPKSLGTTDEVK